jgi:hypothetical protein
VKSPFLHSFEIGWKCDYNSKILKQSSALCTCVGGLPGVDWEQLEGKCPSIPGRLMVGLVKKIFCRLRIFIDV